MTDIQYTYILNHIWYTRPLYHNDFDILVYSHTVTTTRYLYLYRIKDVYMWGRHVIWDRKPAKPDTKSLLIGTEIFHQHWLCTEIANMPTTGSQLVTHLRADFAILFCFCLIKGPLRIFEEGRVEILPKILLKIKNFPPRNCCEFSAPS